MQRKIRSFVRREGRITKRQVNAIEALSDRILSSNESFDQSKAFGRIAPLTLEIGFGMGQSLLTTAQAQPDHDFIGVEVHRPGVGALLADMKEQDTLNICVYSEDVCDVLEKAISDDSLDRVLIFFPDPWHKARHHKRRLVQSDFIDLLARKLKNGGMLHLATDWENYAEHMLLVMEEKQQFKRLADDADPRPETKFERRGLKLGHGVWDFCFSLLV